MTEEKKLDGKKLYRFCGYRKMCFEKVPVGEGYGYTDVIYYPLPEGEENITDGFGTPLDAHKFYSETLDITDADNLKYLENLWKEAVLPFLERVYGRRKRNDKQNNQAD